MTKVAWEPLEISTKQGTCSTQQPGGQLRLGQTNLTPSLGQPPTEDSVQFVKLRMLAHHGLAGNTILQIEPQRFKPIRVLTYSLVISY